MTGLILLGSILGYLLLGAITFRLIVVWYLDHEPEYGAKHDRDELINVDFGWVLAGAFFWPFTLFCYLFYKAIIKQLWVRPTPGERKAAQERFAENLRRASDEH